MRIKSEQKLRLPPYTSQKCPGTFFYQKFSFTFRRILERTTSLLGSTGYWVVTYWTLFSKDIYFFLHALEGWKELYINRDTYIYIERDKYIYFQLYIQMIQVIHIYMYIRTILTSKRETKTRLEMNMLGIFYTSTKLVGRWLWQIMESL